VRKALWDLPSDTFARFLVTLRRAITRRCPYCGGPGIFSGYFALREHCPTCGVRFEREQGYFLGGYALNLIVAEILGLGLALFLIFRTAIRDMDLIWQEAIALTLAVLFPVLFFPYSRSAWMVLDLTFHPPREVLEGQRPGKVLDDGKIRD
jgi:uncharacterized protein (DUF983 family)